MIEGKEQEKLAKRLIKTYFTRENVTSDVLGRV